MEIFHLDVDRFLFLRLAPSLPLLIHQFLESLSVDGEATLARHQFGQIDREAVGIVQFEHKPSRHDHPSAEWRDLRNIRCKR